jgi:hypothetical protein
VVLAADSICKSQLIDIAAPSVCLIMMLSSFSVRSSREKHAIRPEKQYICPENPTPQPALLSHAQQALPSTPDLHNKEADR